MIDFPKSELTPQENKEARVFWNTLPAPDKRNLHLIFQSVVTTARRYVNSDQADANKLAFCRGSILGGIKEYGYPFFLLALIGGTITKENARPDIDLLLAFNARWTHGFFSPIENFDDPDGEFEPTFASIWNSFGRNPSVISIPSEQFPNDYNIGVTKGATLLSINPSKGKPIHLKYIRSFGGCKYGYKFITEDDFSRLDTDHGLSIPKLPLLRITGPKVGPLEFR